MLLAKLAATRSTCRAAAVGAVVVKDKQVLATGYNGPPAGAHHCTDMGYCYEGISRCDADQAYPSRSSHAEANAIAMAAKKGISVDGATIYATLEPCLSCLKLIIASGIKEIYFEVPLALRTDGQGFAKAALVNEGLVRMERYDYPSGSFLVAADVFTSSRTCLQPGRVTRTARSLQSRGPSVSLAL
jgi:dCMP deaminase